MSREQLFTILAIIHILGGCTPSPEPTSETKQQLDLTGIVLTADLKPIVDSARMSLLNESSTPNGPIQSDLQRYHELMVMVQRPDQQNQAAIEIYEKWERDPGNVLWMDLAKWNNPYIHRSEDLAAMFARPDLADTNTALGLYVRGLTGRNNSQRIADFQNSLSRGSGLTPLARMFAVAKIAWLESKFEHYELVSELLTSNLEQARDVGGCRLELLFLNRLSRCQTSLGNPDNALHIAALSAEMASILGLPYRKIQALQLEAAALVERGEYDTAFDILSEGEALSRQMIFPRLLAQIRSALARIQARRGRLRDALLLDQKVLDHYLAVPDSTNIPRVSVTIAENLWHLGELDSAEVYINRALICVANYYHPVNYRQLPVRIIPYYLICGRYDVVDSLLAVTRQRNPDESLDLVGIMAFHALQNAVDAGRPVESYRLICDSGQLHDRLAKRGAGYKILNELDLLSAGFLLTQGEYGPASEALSRVEVRLNQRDDKYSRWVWFWRSGELAYVRSDLVTAERNFSTALALANDLEDPDLVATSSYNLGLFHLANNDLVSANLVFEKVAQTRGGGFFRTHMSALIQLAKIKYLQGDANAGYLACAKVDSIAARSMPSDLSIQLELNRGRCSRELGRTLEAEKAFQRALEILQIEGVPYPSGTGLVFAQDTMHELLVAMVDLYVDYPELVQDASVAWKTLQLTEMLRWAVDEQQYRTVPITSESLIPNVDGPIVVYLLGDRRSYAWLLKNGQPYLHILPPREEIEDLVDRFLAGSSRPAEAPGRKAAEHLGRILLEPIGKQWRPDELLTLIPDGVLHAMPWPALPWPADPHRGSIVDNAPVQECPSLRWLAHQNNSGTRPSNIGSKLLAIGVDNTLGQVALRHAEAEVRHIAQVWPPDATKLMTGTQANWDSWHELSLEKFKAIHIATHTTVYKSSPGNSVMRMADQSDGVSLSIEDIARLDLNADLVFLSCCRTANQIAGNRGISDFARAFLNAGSRSVIAPANLIDDEAARLLATEFYKHWLAGKNKACALQLAQQALRRHPSWEHPYYWAFYRLIGDGS